jgi:hypothetical protein
MKNICNIKRLKALCLTSDKLAILNSIDYNSRTKRILITLIEFYFKHDIDVILLYKNWEEIIKLGRDSSSKKSYITRYGEEIGLELWKDKTDKSTQTKEKFIEKYGVEETSRRLSARGASLENYVNRHGEEEGNRRWITYCEKRAATYKSQKENGHQYPSTGLNHYIKLYGEQDGRARYKEKCATVSYKNSLEGFIEKYGLEIGTQKCKDAKNNNSLDKLTSIYGSEVGLERYNDIIEKNRYSRSIAGFKDRYGDDLGLFYYNEMCRKIGYANTLEYYLTKYGHDGKSMHQARYEKTINALNDSKRFSKWSFDVCTEISKTIDDLYYYGKNEIRISCKGFVGLNIWVSPDLFYNGKIIEFNGDCWHANPETYKSDDKPNPLNADLTAAEIWAKDAAKLRFYESKGYAMLTIWNSEYKRNKVGVIEKCLTFLTT